MKHQIVATDICKALNMGRHLHPENQKIFFPEYSFNQFSQVPAG
jgi:hypothetical protein